LIAPSVLFFATTGVLQIWSLHEAHGDYTPPPVIEKLSSLHKDQRFTRGHHHAPPAAKTAAAAPKAAAPAHADEAPKPAIILLKAFFTAVATGLILSTLAGIWMALSQSPQRRMLAILMLVGAVTPLALAVFAS
jgi:hypothetical protein